MTREEKIARAHELRAEGVYVSAIAEELGVAKSTVVRWTTPGSNEVSIEGHRRWKAENPDRMRASWYVPCPSCGKPMTRKADRCRDCRIAIEAEGPAHKWNTILDLWNEGKTFPQIMEIMGVSRGHLGAEMSRMRDAGVPLAYRYEPRSSGNAAARMRRA